MKKLLYFFVSLFLILSCNTTSQKKLSVRENFTKEEQKIITTAKQIITNCHFATVISIDKKGQPRARVMEPFAPDKNFVIWLGTNPKSRKVTQIKNNAKVTLHYYDKANFGYVSLMGNAFLVDDEALKATKFKNGWDKFYKNQTTDFLLIKFVPETLELISIPNKFTGDAVTWKPHSVVLRE